MTMPAQKSSDQISAGVRPEAERAKVFVHIGLEKTGSSSIQEWLVDRAGKGATPYCYPAVGLVHFHHLQLAQALGFSLAGGSRAAEVRQDFGQAIVAATGPVVISSEHFSVNDTPTAIGRLAEFLRGQDVTVVVFLRNQVNYLLGLYEEHVKWGGTLTLQEYYPDTAPILCHGDRLERWADAFGAQAIKAIVYEDQPDAISAFADAVLGETLPAQSRPRLNPGLAQIFLEAIRRANLTLPERSRRSHFDRAVIALDGMRKGPSRIWPLPEAFMASLAELDEGNGRLARRYLKGRAALFPESLNAYAARYSKDLRAPGPDVEEAIEVISRLVAQG